MAIKINKYILAYSVTLLLICLIMSYKGYRTDLINNAGTFNENRDVTMGYFSYKWDMDNNRNYSWWRENNYPRWYKIALEPSFIHLSTKQKKQKANDYIEQYIGNAFGIDKNEIKDWIFNLIDDDSIGVVKLNKVFAKTNSYNMEQDIYDNHLRQRITFMPLHQKWSVFAKELRAMTFALFLLFVLPVIVLYAIWRIILSAINYIKNIRRS